jgi:hypothetical protein
MDINRILFETNDTIIHSLFRLPINTLDCGLITCIKASFDRNCSREVWMRQLARVVHKWRVLHRDTIVVESLITCIAEARLFSIGLSNRLFISENHITILPYTYMHNSTCTIIFLDLYNFCKPKFPFSLYRTHRRTWVNKSNFN